MILEALNLLATSVISPRKKAGEINASVRLWSRARRCARHWTEHERNCKAFVMANMPVRGRIAVVLGSGLLRDVPIEALSRQFDHVRLYDLQHLASVRLWARLKGMRNLSFINRDLSGSLDFLRGDKDIDLIISANLLSQLGVAASRGKADAAPVIEAHLQGFAALPGVQMLLTDVAYDIVGRDGQIIENHDLLHGVAMPAHDDSWLWTVAPLGELDPGYQAVHRVIAAKL